MTKIYLLVKHKSRRSWQIDKVRTGISKSKLKKIAMKRIKPGFNFKILSENELIKFITKQKLK